ncbi:glycosyltransferase [Alphaproteobacteria bacterium]|nr:glycosyltransferase [Alphaproteobacteria bacterium]
MVNQKKYDVFLCAKKDKFIKNIKIKNIKYLNLNSKDRSYSFFQNLITLFNYKKFLKIYSFDYVLSFTIKPNLFLCFLKFFYKFKLIITLTGLGDIFLNNNILNLCIKKIYLKLMSNADYIFCHNQHDVKLLLSLNNNLKNKISYIDGSGIDLKKYKYSPIKFSNKKTFLMPSRIIQNKGILEFIQASLLLDKNFPGKCNFLICGSSYDNSNFNTIFKTIIKKSPVVYLGFKANLSHYIENATCIVLPSYREGLSKVLLESLSIGRPIITTDVPGCDNIVINNKNGLLVNSRDNISLYSAMKKIYLFDNKSIRSFSLFSKKHSLKFDENIVLYNYIKILKVL